MGQVSVLGVRGAQRHWISKQEHPHSSCSNVRETPDRTQHTLDDMLRVLSHSFRQALLVHFPRMARLRCHAQTPSIIPRPSSAL